MDDVSLENVSHTRILCVTVVVTFPGKIINTMYTISLSGKIIALLNRTKHFQPLHTRITYFNAHILSRVTNCLSILENCINLDRLFKLQKRAARIILNIIDT